MNVQLTESGLYTLIVTACDVAIAGVNLDEGTLTIRYKINEAESLYSLNCVADTIVSGIKRSLLCTQTAAYVNKDNLVIEFELPDY